MRIIPAFAMLLVLVVAPAVVAQEDLLEERNFLNVTIGGKLVRLEALTVKRVTAVGRLPIVLIAHGKPTTQGRMSDQHVENYVTQARDLARRGWLAVVVMRRGFGASDGPPPAPFTCATSSLLGRFNSDADELAATLDAVAQRADADNTRIAAIGVSAGGAAVVALSARNPPGLMAVINVSGGLRIESCAAITEEVLVTAIRAFGVESRVPSLWVYAKNDSFFGPDLVERMRLAFLEGGGDAKLVMLEPEGRDGHAIFSTPGGRSKWLPEMDGFFRYRKLPTWTRVDVDALMQKLDTKNRGLVERYIAGPSEKVLAREKGGSYLNGSQGMPTVDLARQRGLAACERTKPKCEIIMENDHWVVPGS